MSKQIEVKVPDIGEYKNVDVIEVLVKPGDAVAKDQALVTLESDKATMEIPSSHAGVVRELLVKVGAKVSEGTPILRLEAGAGEAPVKEKAPAKEKAPEEAKKPDAPKASAPAAAAKPEPAATAGGPQADHDADVVVIGGGPGGYTAAFRAADLGQKVVLVEKYPRLGGVCLNVGCIPSKALLHVAHIVSEARELGEHGVAFGKPKFDLDKLRAHKDAVITRLTNGLAGLAKQRKVTVIQGVARFASANELRIEDAAGKATRLRFGAAIVAAGSHAARIPGFPEDPRIMDSTGALALADVPKRLLVIGGGIIGLEMATVYDALGSKVSVVEATAGLIPGCDRDLVRPLQRRIEKRYENIWLSTKVTRVEAGKSGLTVHFEGDKAPKSDSFDRILVAVGRRPNGGTLDAEAAGVAIDERGFIRVDAQQRTNVAHIYAIGDITGDPMLAHKATHEAKVAAEVIAGHKAGFDAQAIPSVAYTDPEIAWMGLTEEQAKKDGVAFEKAVFPWAASGRSLSLGRDEGMTKILFDKETHRVIGAGIVGPNAGELIAETVLALEMGADAQDIALTIHPHPTLSETVGFAAEVADGSITDILPPKR